jgi:hypothetical protein
VLASELAGDLNESEPVTARRRTRYLACAAV